MKYIGLAILCIVLLLAAGCDDGGPDPVVLEMLQPAPLQALAGQQVPISVRARRGQQAASGVTVTWAVEAGGGTVTPASVSTDSDGRAQTSWTLGTALVANVAVANAGASPVRFEVTPNAGQPADLVIVSGNTQSAEVNQFLDDSLVVRVQDQFGNPVASATVAFATQDGTIAPASVVTGLNGQASARWRMSTRAGAQQATAALGTTRSIQFTATATPGPMVSGTITPPGNITAGDSLHLQFLGLDPYGNQIVNAPATYNSADSDIAVITANGAVRGLVAGTVRITGQSGPFAAHIDLTFAPFRYARFTVGADHTCAMALDNRLYCFGGGGQGQLGTGDTDDRLVVTEVAGSRTYVRASASAFFTCGVASDQRIYCWGRNQEAQMGNGTATLTPMTTPAATMSTASFELLATGMTGVCGQTTTDRVLCWGGSNLNIDERSSDLAFASLVGSPANGHACGLTSDGALYCWGRNNAGQLGNNTLDDSAEPVRVLGQFGAVAVGSEHTCALGLAGELYCWGRGDLGQLGYMDSATEPLEPCGPVLCRRLPASVGSFEFARLSAFGSSNCAVSLQGEAFCWGRDDGQLGNTVANSPACASLCDPTPTPVETTLRFNTIGVGATHSCAVRPQGDLFCWGTNQRGQMGRDLRSAAGELFAPAPVFAPRR